METIAQMGNKITSKTESFENFWSMEHFLIPKFVPCLTGFLFKIWASVLFKMNWNNGGNYILEKGMGTMDNLDSYPMAFLLKKIASIQVRFIYEI